MNESGLYPLDVRVENYPGGSLVDFGQALTVPSCVFDVVDKDIAEGEWTGSIFEFDEIIKSAGIWMRLRGYNERVWADRTRAGRAEEGAGELVMLKGKGVRAAPIW